MIVKSVYSISTKSLKVNLCSNALYLKQTATVYISTKQLKYNEIWARDVAVVQRLSGMQEALGSVLSISTLTPQRYLTFKRRTSTEEKTSFHTTAYSTM